MNVCKDGNEMKSEWGTLWEKVVAQTQYAINCGALHSLPTDFEFIEQAGVRFAVRILANIERKERAKREQQLDKRSADFNPFLPYEEDLYVTDLGKDHLCLLNKFNVFDHHLLIITRHFEEQTQLLNASDFAALARCMTEFAGLAFYNGGKIAGASQRHKHLQYVPLPLAPTGPPIPMQPLLELALTQTAGESSTLPFGHAITTLPPADTVDEMREALWIAYRRLCAKLNLAGNGAQQSAHYNLLATRQWMMLVPRQHECYETISVNALGFAGSLFVRNQEELAFLRAVGPMRVLEFVGVGRTEIERSRH